MALNPVNFIGFGDIHGPKPFKFIGLGAIQGPRPRLLDCFLITGSVLGGRVVSLAPPSKVGRPWTEPAVARDVPRPAKGSLSFCRFRPLSFVIQAFFVVLEQLGSVFLLGRLAHKNLAVSC